MLKSTIKIKRNVDYRLSFGTGGLYVNESIVLLNLYLECEDWSQVIEKSVENNILQFKSDASTRRATREICIRLQSLLPEERSFFLDTDTQDQSMITWVSVCRTYDFIGTFASSILIDSYASYRLELGHADFDFFFEEQIQWHSELEEVTETTRKKLRQILFRMMREAGFLSRSMVLNALTPSSNLRNLTQQTNIDLGRFIPGVAA